MNLRLRCSVWMLTAAMLSATAVQAQQKNDHIPACESCHKRVVKNYAARPHDRQSPARHEMPVACESCHGPGAAHAKNGSVAFIFDPAHAPAKDVNAKCLQCHEAARPHYQHSVHGARDISCLGCHAIHDPAASSHLLKSTQPELCIQCHGDVKAQFSAPFHHKEGLIHCTDCHDPHGAAGESELPTATVEFVTCTKCHAAIAGPFLYEHAPVKAEGCTACHFAHGGPNPALLIAARVNTICLQCHFPSTDSTETVPAVAAHKQSAQSQSCVSCHVAIHGSNVSSVFLETNGKKNDLLTR